MTVQNKNSILFPPKRIAWNKGKLVGAKPPLLARHAWSIRTKLQIQIRTREWKVRSAISASRLMTRFSSLNRLKSEPQVLDRTPFLRRTGGCS
jgi:hypothetical protein